MRGVNTMDNEINDTFVKEFVKKENNPFLYHFPAVVLGGSGAVIGGAIGICLAGPLGGGIGAAIGGGFGVGAGEKFRLDHNTSSIDPSTRGKEGLEKKEN